MIEAQKGGPFGWAWSRYVDHRLARDFRGVWLTGAMPKGRGPFLFYANHPSWWDGFAFFRLTRAWGLDGYCLMEEQNLARYRFLRRLGAFSIRRGDPRSALESLRYAARLLSRPGAAVVVFPQGVLEPHARPPFTLDRGVEVLARLAKVQCVPLGLRPCFLDGEKPDLLMHVGQAHGPAGLERFASGLEEAVSSVLAISDVTQARSLPRRGRIIGDHVST